MIEKIPGNTKINKLRLINIYQADYNLIRKYFWPHKATHHAEQFNLLGETQWGTKPMCIAEMVASIDEFYPTLSTITKRSYTLSLIYFPS